MKYCEKCGADIKPKIHHFCTLNQNPFNCDKCDFKNGRNLIEFLDHYKNKHGGKDIPCNVCQFRGKFPVNFRNHVRSVHSSLIIMSSFVLVRNTSAGPDRSVFTYYLCTNCGRTFPQSNRERLEVHVRLECQHSNNNQTQSVKSDIIASIKRSNENLAKLLTEISPSITIIPKPSTSPLYGDDFDDEDSMRKYSHQKVAKKDPCPCEFCRDPRFEEVKLHKCYLDPNCHKTFSKVTHLKAHIRCHKNERPFECDWPKCGKSFVRSDELRRHACACNNTL